MMELDNVQIQDIFSYIILKHHLLNKK